MATPTRLQTFAEATTVQPITSHTYSANFPSDWCIGTVPHGGYVTSVFLSAASAHFSSTLSAQNQPHTIALHLDFLRRTQTGPALFTITDVKLGRQTSVVQISLSQGGRVEVVGYLTNSNIYTESGISFPTAWKLSPEALPVDLGLLGEDKDANWGKQAEMPFASFRKATLKTEFFFPRAGQRSKSSADEWVRLRSGERWTMASLGYICDMWPMPVEAYMHRDNPYQFTSKSTSPTTTTTSSSSTNPPPAKFWYPTLLLNLDIKKLLPDEGVEWLFVRVDTKTIKNGRLDLDIVIMDEGGEVVALSQHVGLVVGSERNLADRKGSGSGEKGGSKI